jgi:hypothetical protein
MKELKKKKRKGTAAAAAVTSFIDTSRTPAMPPPLWPQFSFNSSASSRDARPFAVVALFNLFNVTVGCRVSVVLILHSDVNVINGLVIKQVLKKNGQGTSEIWSRTLGPLGGGLIFCLFLFFSHAQMDEQHKPSVE